MPGAQRKKSSLKSHATWLDAGVSILILLVCTLVGYLFYSLSLSEANIISIYILGILLISSVTSSWIYGAISSVVGVLLFNFLYADPIFNFYVYDLQYSITTMVMLAASLVTNYIMSLFRLQLDREKLEIRRLDILLETSQQLQKTENTEGIFTVALTQLYQMFEHPIVIYPVTPGGIQPPLAKGSGNMPVLTDLDLDAGSLEAFVRSTDDNKSITVPLDRKRHAVCFKLLSGKTLYALTCIVIDANRTIHGFEYNLVLAMLDEIGQSMEKFSLQQFNERIAREAEAERLRTNLLRSISHDLRTPLTSISGNADMLMSNGEKLDQKVRRQMYQSIQSDSEWLITLVENLLFITRIDNGVMSISTEYEVLQDVVQESLDTMTKRAREHAVHLEMSDEPLVVKVDARLLMQVIINILDNALNHTPARGNISVRVFADGATAVVAVADHGCGIADEEKTKVFEMFYTTNKQSSDSRRGIGLGLPLSQAIINAHGGSIHIADNHPSGLVVSFALALEAVE